jgi:hypothetical protein
MRLLLAIALASALAVAAGAEAGSRAFAPRAFTPRKCGEITIRKGTLDSTYSVKVFQAPLACTTAQTTMTRFIQSGTIPRRWFCRFGHSRDAWAATCARTAENAPIVRAYLVIR